MAARRPELKTVEYLIYQARTRPGGALPDETHTSYPIPVSTRAGLRAVFLFCPTRVDPRLGTRVGAPSYHAVLHADTGFFEEMRAFSASGLLVPEPADRSFIGTLAVPAGATQEEYLRRQAQLFEQLDRILPAFAVSDDDLSDAERASARAAALLFPVVLEQPLVPYYQAIGRAFFAWLEKAAGAPVRW